MVGYWPVPSPLQVPSRPLNATTSGCSGGVASAGIVAAPLLDSGDRKKRSPLAGLTAAASAMQGVDAGGCDRVFRRDGGGHRRGGGVTEAAEVLGGPGAAVGADHADPDRVEPWLQHVGAVAVRLHPAVVELEGLALEALDPGDVLAERGIPADPGQAAGIGEISVGEAPGVGHVLRPLQRPVGEVRVE